LIVDFGIRHTFIRLLFEQALESAHMRDDLFEQRHTFLRQQGDGLVIFLGGRQPHNLRCRRQIPGLKGQKLFQHLAFFRGGGGLLLQQAAQRCQAGVDVSLRCFDKFELRFLHLRIGHQRQVAGRNRAYQNGGLHPVHRFQFAFTHLRHERDPVREFAHLHQANAGDHQLKQQHGAKAKRQPLTDFPVFHAISPCE
jgi:hypothetical protein